MSVGEPKILVIEDEPEMRRFLRVSLGHSGYRQLEAQTAKEGLARAMNENPELILLDLELPDGDGLDVIRQIRQWSSIPIIVISGRELESDKVQALDLGADDYLSKPFYTQELLARVRVALRHAAVSVRESNGVPFEIGELRFDLIHRQVFVAGRDIHLTPLEFRLLSVLVRHAGLVVTHRQLLNEVWGPGRSDKTHYVRVLMAAVRNKIEPDSAHPKYLLTEPGIGYRMASGSPL